MTTNYSQHIVLMRHSLNSGASRSIPSRKKRLKDLASCIKKYEEEILDALRKDLGKSAFEAMSTEVVQVQEEIKLALTQLDEWTAPKTLPTPLAAFPSKATLSPQPRGLVLIISPWNYPFQLTMAPLISAIAAGNHCVVKPSELSSHTTSVISRLLREAIPQEVVYVVEGDASIATELLTFDWDQVFFTGSAMVGRIIAKSCAEKLTPCTLELGGKSPAIIDKGINIKSAARKVVWGKFLNAGQTCIGVDYLLVHESIKDEFIAAMRHWIRAFYGEDPQLSPDYSRIINYSHYERITAMITAGTAVYGSRRDRSDRYIEPTIIDGVTLDHPAMAQEIFGPILPVLTWRDKGDIFNIVAANPNPLALYLFTKDADLESAVLEGISFGGGCINHTVLHFTCSNLPFGGVRQSGLGAYHGKFGFDLFSHSRGILSAGALDIPIKYPKDRAWKLILLKWIYR
ncbi:MAG: aldehyde dehydrogenase family protein [Proteobacteria bacterium]|nr:aldehyde dehydrogenase family protein [Pseudomonadota bacterium]